jgi:hypothetical protein
MLVIESKVVAWLQDEVLQRTTHSNQIRGSRRRPIEEPTQLELAIEGLDLEVELTNRLTPLKFETIKVYSAAIAELYYTQVSIGLNTAPSF